MDRPALCFSFLIDRDWKHSRRSSWRRRQRAWPARSEWIVAANLRFWDLDDPKGFPNDRYVAMFQSGRAEANGRCPPFVSSNCGL